MRSLLRPATAIFLPIALLAILLTGLVYGVAQQLVRTGADEPQLQLAEDAAAALDAGAEPASIVLSGSVDLARSLAAFMVVTDGSGGIVAGNGVLDGAPAAPPPGVLAAARAGTADRVTWQPRAGVRIAQATVGWSGGAVTVGRSLREAERRADALLLLCVAALGVTLVALGVASLVAARLASAP